MSPKSLPQYLGLEDSEILQDVIDDRIRTSEKIEKRKPLIVDFTNQLLALKLNFWVIGSRAVEAYFENHAPNYLQRSSSKALSKASLSAQGFDIQVATKSSVEQKRVTKNVYQRVKALKKTLEQVSVKTFHIETLGFSQSSFGVPVRVELFNGYAIRLWMNDFVLLYIVVLDMGNINLDKFKKAYLDVIPTPYPHLNVYGIMTYLEFIKSKRKEKKLNIDAFRKTFVQQYIEKDLAIKPAKLYQQLYLVYEDVWKRSPLYSKIFSDTLILDSLKSNSEYKVFLSSIDSKIVEFLRAPMNAIVKHINDSLMSDEICFVAGGDAIRRYTTIESVTNDIDVKVFCPYGEQSARFKTMLDKIGKICANSIGILKETKGLFLPKVIRHGDVRCVLVDTNNDAVQFRLRRIDPHEGFPLYLYSIDYQMKIVHGLNTFEHTVALVDLAIFPNKSVNTHSVQITPSGLPVASLPYIVKDLKKTWKSHELAGSRIWAGKRDKNLARYKEVTKVRLAHPSEALLQKLNKVDVRFTQTLRSLGSKSNVYYVDFKKLSTVAASTKQIKVMAPFNLKHFIKDSGSYSKFLKLTSVLYKGGNSKKSESVVKRESPKGFFSIFA